MSNLVNHAKHELALLGSGEPDEMSEAMNAHILKMVETFADEGHSGFSASYAVSVLEKLLRYEPLQPLTGEADEWNEIGEGEYQNRRCSHVFKGPDGRAYDSEAVIFREPSGACYTSRESRRFVEFPYKPTRTYVDRPVSA